MKSQYAGQCAKVPDHTWGIGDEVFLSKTSDGNSWIKCNDKACFESQGGKIDSGGGKGKFVSQKFPISEATKIYDLSELILDSFKKKRMVESMGGEQEG